MALSPSSRKGATVARGRSGGGAIVVYITSDPAGGEEVIEIVPEKKAWRLISFRVALTVAGGSTNKRSRLELQDEKGVTFFSANAADETAAGSSAIVTFADSSPPATTALHTWGPLPRECLLGPGYKIVTSGGLQLADDYSAGVLMVEEFDL